MGVFKRVSDILSANLHEVVEHFESPEAMLRQAIREMDSAVARTMEAAARVIADERLLESETDRFREADGDLQRRAREAVERGDDEGARRALSRRHEQHKLAAALGAHLARVREAGAKLRRRLDALRRRRDEAGRSLNLLLASRRAAQAQRQLAWQSAAGFEIDVGAFDRFERIRRKIERAEAEADALAELAQGAGAFDGPEQRPDRIETELAALKAQCSL